MDLERLKRIRISSPRREERVKFLSDSESEKSLNEDDTLNSQTGKIMTEKKIVQYTFDTVELDLGPERKQQKTDELVSERKKEKSTGEKTNISGKYGFKDLIKTKKVSDVTMRESKDVNEQDKTEKTNKAAKSEKKKDQNDLFVEDIITPDISPRPGSAIRRIKIEQYQIQRITLPVFPKAPKLVPKTSFNRVGGGWMRTEDYLRNHIPIRVYQHQRPFSGNSYLYLNSKFVSEKDSVLFVYKNRNLLLQSPRYYIPMSINDKLNWNKYDTFLPGQ